MLKARAKLLQKYLCDEQKELQALYALQALVVTLDQPPSKSQATGMVGVGGLEELPNCRGTVVERVSTQEKWVVPGEQNIFMVESFSLQHCFLTKWKALDLALKVNRLPVLCFPNGSLGKEFA